MGTKGINPFFQSEEEIQQELTHSLLPQLPEGTINSVFLWCRLHSRKGSRPSGGPSPTACLSSEISKPTRICLPLPADYADMKQGLPASLGTGSNSCFYNGEEIVNNISPLGFILGDEGSGAVLGKLLVGDVLKTSFHPPSKKLS